MSVSGIESTIRKADKFFKKGAFQEAHELYMSALEKYPENSIARNRLAQIENTFSNNIQPSRNQLEKLVQFYRTGRFSQGIEYGVELSRQFPQSFQLQNILGAIYKNAGLLDEAERCFTNAININVDYLDGFCNLAATLKEKNENNKALEIYHQALAIDKNCVEALLGVANLYFEKNEIETSISYYTAAKEHAPKDTRILENLGVAFRKNNQINLSIQTLLSAKKYTPDDPSILNNLGASLLANNQYKEAEIELAQSIQQMPQNADAFNNLGTSLKHQGKNERAIQCFEKSLSINGQSAITLNNLGSTLMKVHKSEDAIIPLENAVRIDPNFSMAFANLGDAYVTVEQPVDAIRAYRNAVNTDSENIYSINKLQIIKRSICDWSDEHTSHTEKSSTPLKRVHKHAPPFGRLCLEDNPEKQLEASKAWAKGLFYEESPLPLEINVKNEKIRLAYFSADFHEFPGMYLMAGMLEKHDRSKFEIYAFSYGPEKNDPMRKRIINAVDHFIDIKDMDTEECVQLSRRLNIDIAIHRNGYTKGNRTELFSSRVAPIQINYLGYPGSMGADFIDYIIADKTVIPEEYKKFYTEKVLYMPHTYQPNDNTRFIASTNTSRSDFGLPKDGIVFCCFNQNYKISTEEFDIWMRVLNQVPQSVLWLLKSNDFVVENLRKEALKRGVESTRLIFAERLPHAEHLARHKHADLFLDTFNYNAHTTASDALWAGLPVVTKIGQQFAARVSASLLNAIEMPELITTSKYDYEQLIIQIAQDSEMLKKLKEKIQTNRETKPLFNTQLYTRAFEDLLLNLNN